MCEVVDHSNSAKRFVVCQKTEQYEDAFSNQRNSNSKNVIEKDDYIECYSRYTYKNVILTVTLKLCGYTHVHTQYAIRSLLTLYT